MTNELKQSRPDTQYAQPSGSNELIHMNGSGKELLNFLRMDSQQFNILRSIQFDKINMRGDEFVNAIQHIKTLQSIKLTNLNFQNYFDSSRKILLPNMEEYVLQVEERSSDQMWRTMKDKSGKGNFFPREWNFSLETLIFFAKGNTSEELWTTCLSLRYIQLKVSPSFTCDRVLRMDTNNSELVIDSVYEYSRPHFLKTILGLKKLTLTNVDSSLVLSFVPPSVTHLFIIDVASLIRSAFQVALKSMKELVSINIAIPYHLSDLPLHLSFLSPQLRSLCVGNLKIVSSYIQPFTRLDLLILNECELDEICTRIPFIFSYVKKCYFVPYSKSYSNALDLKKLIEITALELILVKDFTFLCDLEGMRSDYGVPINAKSFGLEKTEGQWSLVRLSDESMDDIFSSVYTGGMDLTTFIKLLT